jgi:hypothetical protein
MHGLHPAAIAEPLGHMTFHGIPHPDSGVVRGSSLVQVFQKLDKAGCVAS